MCFAIEVYEGDKRPPLMAHELQIDKAVNKRRCKSLTAESYVRVHTRMYVYEKEKKRKWKKDEENVYYVTFHEISRVSIRRGGGGRGRRKGNS